MSADKHTNSQLYTRLQSFKWRLEKTSNRDAATAADNGDEMTMLDEASVSADWSTQLCSQPRMAT